jgi:hypothetical protein
MCRYHDTRYIGHCSHDEADRVVDKESANYCTLYSPNPDAFVDKQGEPAACAKRELDALFGSNEVDRGSAEETPETSLSPRARALREAESLFDLGNAPETKDKR